MINLELEVEHVDIILNVLGQTAYNLSAPIIEEIKRQAIPQLPEAPKDSANE
jgi:hypothetical protein